MRHQAKTLLNAIVMAALLCSCRTILMPLPVLGNTADVAAMAGHWDGEFSSAASGRSGSILFEITPGGDTARGEVLMTPSLGQPLRAADAAAGMHAQHVTAAEYLTVQFVRIDAGAIRGELEPYVVPDCQCAVSTTFRGTVAGNRVDGTYTTRGPNDLVQEGRWSAVRRVPGQRRAR